MRFTELRPVWGRFRPMGDGIYSSVSFDCPITKKRHNIEFRPFIDPYNMPADIHRQLDASRPGLVWERNGDTFDTISFAPSIQCECCHFSVKDGEVIP